MMLARTLFAVFLASAVAAPAWTDHIESFDAFKEAHNRDYSSPVVEAYRYGIFRSNLALVNSHNELYARGLSSFRLAVNQFADLTNDEYRSLYMGYRRKSNSVANATFVANTLDALPAEVDWRTHSPKVVSAVKDQGQCGSCWAFSAVGAMEGANALASGSLALFSEQELVDCTNGGDDDCDHGGEMQDGFAYVIDHGIENEQAYPYTAESKHKCKFEKAKSVASFSSFTNVTSFDEDALKAAIAQVPTISIAIDADSFLFQLYDGGIYDNPRCKNKVDELDHGVLLVGYGTEDGTDYWLVKNSWGQGWGMDGYIKMMRNADNQCGVATDASFPVV